MAVPSTMVPLGTPAPSFELADPAGDVVRSDDLRGAPALVVMFICNHCPYVQLLRPALASVTSSLIDRGVAVVGINSNDAEAYPDDSPEAMVAEVAEHGYRFPYLVDAEQTVAAAYRAACTPDFFVFDGEQRLAYRGRFDGARPGTDVEPTGAELLAAVEAVLAGEAPPAEQRPSLGCSIKWKPGNEPG